MGTANCHNSRRLSWDAVVTIVGVLMIIYIWLSTLLYVLIPWAQSSWHRYAGLWIAYLAVLHLLLIMSLWSFFMATFTSPGGVPLDFKNFVMRHAAGSGANFEVHWCKRCELPKPPRTHHCSHGCNTCILKMDHHCPWISNCVGFRNHGHFLRYVTYTLLAALLAESLLVWRVSQMIWWPETIKPGAHVFTAMMPVSLKEALVLLFNTIWLAAALVMLTILTGVTLRNVLENCTTIEQLEIEAELKYSRRTKQAPAIFPFDVGIRKNLELVLGRRIWAWPFPLPPSWQLAGVGDGITFPINSLVSSEYQWPPSQTCSNSSCSSATSSLYSDATSVGHEDTAALRRSPQQVTNQSEPDLRFRARRDSDGYILPTNLPWHSQVNLPNSGPT